MPSVPHNELLELSVPELVRQQATRYGSDPFAFYGPDDRSVSFEGLRNKAHAVGNGLEAAGVEQGTNVAVMARNPLTSVLLMYGIPSCGAVYAPISHEFRGATLTYHINDIDPDVLIIEDRFVDRLSEIDANLQADPQLFISETGSDTGSVEYGTAAAFEGLIEHSSDPPETAVTWSDPAWLLYTSGTTGDPKGVILPHRWVVANHAAFRSALFTREDVVHCSLPLNHAGGAAALVTAALRGGASVALWDRFSSSQFWDRIETYEATFTTLVGVMATRLMDAPEREDDRGTTLNKLVSVPLPENPQAFFDRFGIEFVFVLYGQTEVGHPIRGLIHAAKGENATPAAVRKGLPPDEILARANDRGVHVVDEIPDRGYLGRPRSDMVEVAVLDDDGEHLPADTIGELAVRPNRPSFIMDGYYNKPAKTVEACRDLWFHTGDAVYRDEEMNYFFVDRLDDVIRKSGENVSPSHLQDIITEHDAVEQAAAFPIPAEEGREDDIGLALVLGSELPKAALESYMDEQLAGFMHPDEIWFIDEIPQTKTQKIERSKLKEKLLGDE